MYYSDDPVRDFERYERAQAKRLSELPVCDFCDEPIQGEYYYSINGDNICPKCLDRHFKQYTY